MPSTTNGEMRCVASGGRPLGSPPPLWFVAACGSSSSGSSGGSAVSSSAPSAAASAPRSSRTTLKMTTFSGKTVLTNAQGSARSTGSRRTPRHQVELQRRRACSSGRSCQGTSHRGYRRHRLARRDHPLERRRSRPPTTGTRCTPTWLTPLPGMAKGNALNISGGMWWVMTASGARSPRVVPAGAVRSHASPAAAPVAELRVLTRSTSAWRMHNAQGAAASPGDGLAAARPASGQAAGCWSRPRRFILTST